MQKKYRDTRFGVPTLFNSTFQVAFILLFYSFLHSTVAYAEFEEQVQYDLKTHWIKMLNDSSLSNRYPAMQAFLMFPEWGRPLLRSALEDSELETPKWRLVYLLGVLGEQEDIPRLLLLLPGTQSEEPQKILLGALERLFWKFRLSAPVNLIPEISVKKSDSQLNSENPDVKSIPSKPLISKASFSELKTLSVGNLHNITGPNTLQGELSYKIVNPSSEPSLLRLSFDVWRAQSLIPAPLIVHWLEARSAVEGAIPVRFSTQSTPQGTPQSQSSANTSNIRIDFKLQELGGTGFLARHKIEIPVFSSE